MALNSSSPISYSDFCWLRLRLRPLGSSCPTHAIHEREIVVTTTIETRESTDLVFNGLILGEQCSEGSLSIRIWRKQSSGETTLTLQNQIHMNLEIIPCQRLTIASTLLEIDDDMAATLASSTASSFFICATTRALRTSRGAKKEKRESSEMLA